MVLFIKDNYRSNMGCIFIILAVIYLLNGLLWRICLLLSVNTPGTVWDSGVRQVIVKCHLQVINNWCVLICEPPKQMSEYLTTWERSSAMFVQVTDVWKCPRQCKLIWKYRQNTPKYSNIKVITERDYFYEFSGKILHSWHSVIVQIWDMTSLQRNQKVHNGAGKWSKPLYLVG